MMKFASNSKKWFQLNLFIFIFLIGSIGTLNFVVDPLWCFAHKNSLQSNREGFEERQQKINLIHFQDFDYEGIMLGSSRVTVHDTSTIHHSKIFNMAADGMRPYEFNDYIEYAKKANKRPFKYIFLGLDFLAIENSPQQYAIEPYIQNSELFLYRYKTLFSYDTTIITIKNIKNKFLGRTKKRFKTYNQDHTAFASSKEKELVEEKVSAYLVSLKNKKLNYDRQNYLKILHELRHNNPETKFIIFTTPLPAPVLEHLLQNKSNRAIYRQWMKDIRDIFGPFYNFTYLNTINENYQTHYVDEGHYTSEVGNCINTKITGQSCSDPIFDKFGVLIEKNDDLDTILY